MTSCQVAFDKYKKFFLHNIYLGDDSIVKVIEMAFVVIEVMVKGKINFFCIKDVIYLPKL